MTNTPVQIHLWAFNVFTSTLNGCKSRFGILPEDLTQRTSSIWFQHDNDLQYTNLKKGRLNGY